MNPRNSAPAAPGFTFKHLRAVIASIAAISLLLLTLGSAQASGYREVELNDSRATATQMKLGTTYSGTSYKKDAWHDDEDFFALDIPADGRTKINFKFPSGLGTDNDAYGLTVYNSQGTELFAFDLKAHHFDGSELASLGTFLPKGRAYIGIKGDNYWETWAKTYTLNVSQAAASVETEVNDETAAADLIKLNTTYSGSSLSADYWEDQDYFALDLPADGRTKFNFKFPAGLGSDNEAYDLSILNAQGTELFKFDLEAHQHNGSWLASQGTFLPKGRIFVGITGDRDWETWGKTYTLNVTHAAGNVETEFNDDTASADVLKLGATHSGTTYRTDSSYDNDYFAVDMSSAGYVKLNFKFPVNLGAENLYDIEVYNPSNDELYSYSLDSVDANGSRLAKEKIYLPKGRNYLNVSSGTYSVEAPNWGAIYTLNVSRLLTSAPMPTVSGTAGVGSTLRATAGTWKPAPVTLKYQWKRDGKNIAGATKSSYKLVAVDAGKKIAVTVTGSKSGFSPIAKTSAAKSVALQTLTSAPMPTVSGTAGVGSTLRATAGTWKPARVTLKYQWKRDGKNIAGATKSSYKLVAADAGKKIAVTVTGSKFGFKTVSKTSPIRSVRLQSLTTTPIPKVTGTGKIGSTLKAASGMWKPAPVTLKYQWKRNGAAIKGANQSSYKVGKADASRKITVTVTGSKSGYKSVARTSTSKTGKK